MSQYRIPFNRAALDGREADYIREAVEGGHISGDGPFTKRCQALLESELGAVRVLLTTSCTHALEMAGMLAGVGPGDEVVVPSFTFVSTANAFAVRGARVVFCDIRRDTLNMDERMVGELTTERTKVVAPVHYAGVGCEMGAIAEAAARCGAVVVEDNAHGLFGRRGGVLLGSTGAMSTLSFHETKNLTCGEGGALVINDGSYVERAEVLREKGTDRSRFFRGQVDKYTWTDVGSSYVPSEILSAVLWAQLEQRERIQRRREEIWRRYDKGLRGWAARHGVGLPTVPPDCGQSYHMYYLLMPGLEERQRMIEHLKSRGILSVFHYLPLHLSPMGVRNGGRRGQCPVTEEMSDRILRLPFYRGMTWSEQDEVMETVMRLEGYRE